MSNSPIKKTLLEKYLDIMPKGAGALFFIQIFSTLAFSVLYSTLVLYTTDHLKLNDATSTGITASFVAFNYALHLLGGYLGGRYLSYRSLFLIGMITITCGCLLISIPTIECLYWGLAVFLTGAGLNVTCINCMLTQLFQPTDTRREAAFLWNYSGMNIGFFVGFSVSGFFQLSSSYRELFLLSSFGSLIALSLTLFKWKSLADINTKVVKLTSAERRISNLKGFALILFLIIGLRWVIENASFSNHLIMCVGVFMAFVIAYLAFKQPPDQAKKVWAYLILAGTALVFWTLYQIAPMGLTLFFERNVDRHFLGLIIAPQWVQNINTLVIIVGGPLLSMVFSHLRARGIQITIPIQFSFALFSIGIGFVILPVGIHFADAQGYSHFMWIVASYVLQSIGELFISPIGYAMIGQLAPTHLQGIMMGTWMMIVGVAATLSGYFSTMALGTSHSVSPLVTNPSFSFTFNLLGWAAIATSLLLIFMIPLVLRLTQEKVVSLKMEPLTSTQNI